MTPARERPRDERGATTVLVIGFAGVLLALVVAVVDGSAAYRQRQSLTTVAEGAALWAADAGAQGREVYLDGVTDAPLEQTASAARAGVGEYLRAVDAVGDHPGLAWEVRVSGDRVLVRLTAPADLPLNVPGLEVTGRVAATGTALVRPEEPR